MEKVFHYLCVLILLVLCDVINCQTQTLVEETTTMTPSTTSTRGTTTVTSLTSDEERRQRLQQSRLSRILFLQRNVLTQLGWTAPPQIDSETKRRLLQELHSPVYVVKQKQCYYPVCDLPVVELPDYMNRSIWFDTNSRNVRYFFQLPTSNDPNMEVTSATVKIHLKRREDCLCAFGGDPTTSRIHIKIYQYRKPIRSHARLRHSNMRLIDATMVTWESSRWVTLHVTDAIRRIISRGRRNGGFEVHIRDMDENILDAKTIIDPTVCTPTLDFECSEQSMADDGDDITDPNFSPVLEISSTTNSRIEFSYP